MSSSITSDSIALSCENLVIKYDINEYRSLTLKETLLNKLRKQNASEEFVALKGVSLEVKRGECLALIGHNGSGKSTMLKAMAGILSPKAGVMNRYGTCVPLIELGAGFDPELTGRENIFLCLGLLGLSRNQIDKLVPLVRSFSELYDHLDMPVKTYSSGMYMRLGFACSVCVHADILLIDEILAVGDENFQKKCVVRMREIRQSGSTMVLVSHDLTQIQQLADRVAVFNEGSIVFLGHPKEAIDFYHELMDQKRLAMLSREEREEELRQRKLQSNAKVQQIGVRAKMKIGGVLPMQSEKLESGRACTIRIEFSLNENFSENVCIGFAIHTEGNDIRVFGGNTNLLGVLAPRSICSKGRYQVEFRIDSLELAAGNYRLITALHDSTLTETLDINGFAQTFTVENPKNMENFDRDIIDFYSQIVTATSVQLPALQDGLPLN